MKNFEKIARLIPNAEDRRAYLSMVKQHFKSLLDEEKRNELISESRNRLLEEKKRNLETGQLEYDLIRAGLSMVRIKNFPTHFIVSGVPREEYNIMIRFGARKQRLGDQVIFRIDKRREQEEKKREEKEEKKGEVIVELTYDRVVMKDTNNEEDTRMYPNKTRYFKARDMEDAKQQANAFCDVRARREANDPHLEPYVADLIFKRLRLAVNVENIDLSKQPMFQVGETFNYSLFNVDANFQTEEDTVTSCVKRYLIKLLFPFCREGSNGKRRDIRKVTEGVIDGIVNRYRWKKENNVFRLIVTDPNAEIEETETEVPEEVLTRPVDGITPEEVEEIARTFGCSHYCVDPTENVLMRYVPPKRSRLPQIAYVTNGSHLFPITERYWLDSLQNRTSFTAKAQSKKRKEEQGNTERVDLPYEISDEKEIVPRESGHVVLTNINCLQDHFIAKTIETKTIFSHRDYTMVDENMIRLTVKENLTYYVNPDAQIVKDITEKLGVKWTNQSMATVFADFCKATGTKIGTSVLGREFYNRLRKQPRGGINHQWRNSENKEALVGYDFNKMYTHIFMGYHFPIYSPFDEFREAKDVDPNDPEGTFYSVDWEPYGDETPIPLFQGLYCKPLVTYLQSIGRRGRILQKIVPKTSMAKMDGLVNPIIEKIGGLAKHVVNYAIGRLGRCRVRNTKVWYDQNLASSANTLFKRCKESNACVVRLEEAGLWKITEVTESLLYNTNLPMHSMIIQIAWMYTDKLYREMGGKLIRVITDCVITEGGRSDLPVSDKVGGIKALTLEDCNKKVKKMKKETSGAKPVVIREAFARKLEAPITEWTDNIKETADTQTSDLVEKIVGWGGSCFITGLAGTGKSYLARKVIERLTESGIRVKPCAFTNAGANIIGGETLHRMFGLSISDDFNDACLSGFKEGDVVVPDECSLIPEAFYGIFVRLQARGVKFLFVGDFNQLPPVYEEHRDHLESNIVKQLCEGHCIRLTVNRRSDPEMSSLYEKILDGKFDLNDFQRTSEPPSIDEFHIAYRNRTCAKVARTLMRQKAKTLEESEKLHIKHCRTPEHGRKQSMILWRGAPVRGYKGDRDYNVVKNLMYTVEDWTDEELTVISEMGEECYIPINEVKELFESGLVSTCHKAQGRTVKGRIRIWDSDFYRVDKHWLYTAVSRTVGWENVFFHVETEESFREKWDMEMVDAILENNSGDPKLKCLAEVKEKVRDGVLTTCYRPSREAPNGRQYAYPSLQSVPGWVRRLVSHKYYHDVDIENCYPNILLQIAKENEIACPELEGYVQNRETVFETIMAECPTLERKTLKTAFITMLHNGKYTQGTDGVRSDILDRFQSEMKIIGSGLMEIEKYRTLAESVKGNTDKRNKMGTFISRLCQEAENKILMSAVAFSKAEGLNVGVLVFDGLMIERTAEGLPSDFFERLSEAVEDDTGYRVTFVEKSLKPKDEDIQRLSC